MNFVVTKLPSIDFTINNRGIAWLLGKIAAVLAAWLFVELGYLVRQAEKLNVTEVSIADLSALKVNQSHPDLSSYTVVKDRNLFGAAPPVVPVAANQQTPLKLRLVGTNLKGRGGKFAILEDTAKNEQDVFELNDMVFNQAKLIEILAESVRVNYNDRVETLVLEDGGKTSDTGASPRESSGEDDSDDSRTDFTVSEDELNESLNNLPLLLSQARAVPYFRNGQSIGMRLFAIRKDSMYEKLGLKNGDIVLSVNENSLSDPSQALKLFEQLKSERSIGVKLERNGASREMNYSIR